MPGWLGGFGAFRFSISVFWLPGHQICDETGTVNCGNLCRLCPSVSYSLTWGVSAVSFPRYNSLDLRCFFSLYLDCHSFGWEAVPPVIEGFYNLALKYRGYGRQDLLSRRSFSNRGSPAESGGFPGDTLEPWILREARPFSFLHTCLFPPASLPLFLFLQH